MKLAGQGAVIVFIGAVAAWSSSGIPGGGDNEVWSGFLPSLISLALMLIGITMIVVAKTGWQRETPVPQSANSPLATPVVQLMLLAFGYYLALQQLGYLLSTLLAAPLCLAIFRNRAGVSMWLCGLVLPLVLQLLFFELLGIYPIVGSRFDLLETLGSDMEIWHALGEVLSDPSLMLLVLAAAILGIAVGAVPGLTAAAAIAMLIPLSYNMDALPAIAMLYVISKAGRFGGSISAILFNTPGTTASAATQLDGYPLRMQGKTGKALKLATLSSVCGDLIGDILLIASIAALSAAALSMGPPETFAIYLAAFVIVAVVLNRDILKGLCSVLLGMLVSTIGLDPISAQERLTMGTLELSDGIGLVPLMIGMFVMAEVFAQLGAQQTKQAPPPVKTADDGETLSAKELAHCAPTLLQGSFVGAIIGVLPGVGSAVAAFTSYNLARSQAKDPTGWGRGELRGLAAAESANNAVSGTSMIPLLTLGIPGSTIGAILLGALLIHGIEVGPTLFLSSTELIYRIFACGLLGIVCYGLVAYFAAGAIARWVSAISARVLYPVIFFICFAAAYAVRGSLFDTLVMLVAGIAAWWMRRHEFNPAAFVIAFVLTKGCEESFRQSLLMSDAGAGIFLQRPMALIFICISVLLLAISIYRQCQRAVTTTDIRQ